MKKLILNLMAIVFVAVLLTGCGSSMDSDARKMADMTCKLQKLMPKILTGDAAAKDESEKLNNDLTEFSKKLQAKYTSDEDKEKFSKAVLKAMGDCK